MHQLVIIQARVGSSRLPRKVLKKIGTRKMLQHVIDRCKQSGIETMLVTPNTPENDVLEGFGGIPCYRDEEFDVLNMYYKAALQAHAQFICRVTADCPLIEPDLINRTLALAETVDYVNCEGFPRGLWCESFSFESLACAYDCGKRPYHREHVTPYMYENGWLTGAIHSVQPRDYRLCVDEYDDLRTVRNVVSAIGEDCYTREIIQLLDGHPELIMNAHVQQRGLPK